MLRPAAMGIWVIHSAHFINIIMGEAEGGGTEGCKAEETARQLEKLGGEPDREQ